MLCLILTFAIGVGGWQAYENWDTIKGWFVSAPASSNTGGNQNSGGNQNKETPKEDDPCIEEPQIDIPVVFNSISFAADCWTLISAISESGRAREYYQECFDSDVHKEIELTTGEVISVRILGFDHDDKSDGTGKAGMSFGMTTLLATSTMGSSNIGGWEETLMRRETMPNYFSQLPIELRDVIVPVDKLSSIGGGSIASPQLEMGVTSDLIWLFSRIELREGFSPWLEEGQPYEFWAIRSPNERAIARSKRLSNGTGNTETWWLRTPVTTSDGRFARVGANGSLSSSSDANAWGRNGVTFGFAV
jgi:hypothetical protein